MLVFIGLGITEKGISLKGLEEAKSADRVYCELYTSIIPNFKLENLENLIGKPIEVKDRKDVENDPEDILKSAKNGKTAFLVPGDPMIATTHIDLRLRAKKEGIDTKIIHNASIQTAGPGLACLQSYKFGKSATIPLPEKSSKTPYKVLENNQKLGLHTLFLLDIEAEKDRYLTANRAIDYLLNLEEELKREVFTEETLSVIVARAGASDGIVKAKKAKDLKEENFGNPPHILIIPGKLHFLEAEALEAFADSPKNLVEKYVEE